MKTKEVTFVVLFVILLLIIYRLFPVRDVFQQTVTTLVFFVALPLLFNKMVLRKNLNDIGLQIGDWKNGLRWGVISFIIVTFIFFIAIYFFHFLKYYAVPVSIIGNYYAFLFHEFVIVLPLVLVFNLFFQGFILFSLKLKMSFWAVIAQAVIFWATVWVIGSPISTLLPYMVMAPFIGFVAYKSRSVFYSSTTQVLLFIILDAGVIHFVK